MIAFDRWNLFIENECKENTVLVIIVRNNRGESMKNARESTVEDADVVVGFASFLFIHMAFEVVALSILYMTLYYIFFTVRF